jgi:hypothetical protein
MMVFSHLHSLPKNQTTIPHNNNNNTRETRVRRLSGNPMNPCRSRRRRLFRRRGISSQEEIRDIIKTTKRG